MAQSSKPKATRANAARFEKMTSTAMVEQEMVGKFITITSELSEKKANALLVAIGKEDEQIRQQLSADVAAGLDTKASRLSLYYEQVTRLYYRGASASTDEIRRELLPALESIHADIREGKSGLSKEEAAPLLTVITKARASFQARLTPASRLATQAKNILGSEFTQAALAGAATNSPLVALAVFAFNARQRKKRQVEIDQELRQQQIERQQQRGKPRLSGVVKANERAGQTIAQQQLSRRQQVTASRVQRGLAKAAKRSGSNTGTEAPAALTEATPSADIAAVPLSAPSVLSLQDPASRLVDAFGQPIVPSSTATPASITSTSPAFMQESPVLSEILKVVTSHTMLLQNLVGISGKQLQLEQKNIEQAAQDAEQKAFETSILSSKKTTSKASRDEKPTSDEEKSLGGFFSRLKNLIGLTAITRLAGGAGRLVTGGGGLLMRGGGLLARGTMMLPGLLGLGASTAGAATAGTATAGAAAGGAVGAGAASGGLMATLSSIALPLAAIAAALVVAYKVFQQLDFEKILIPLGKAFDALLPVLKNVGEILMKVFGVTLKIVWAGLSKFASLISTILQPVFDALGLILTPIVDAFVFLLENVIVPFTDHLLTFMTHLESFVNWFAEASPSEIFDMIIKSFMFVIAKINNALASTWLGKQTGMTMMESPDLSMPPRRTPPSSDAESSGAPSRQTPPSSDAESSGAPLPESRTATRADYQNLRIKGGASGQATGGGATHAGTVALAQKIQERVPGFVQITGFNDLYHRASSPNSKHTKGLALDFTLTNRGQASKAVQIIQDMANESGAKIKVLDEYARPTARATGGHIHVEFNSESDADKFLSATPQSPSPMRASAAPPPPPTSNEGTRTTGAAGAVRDFFSGFTGTPSLAQATPSDGAPIVPAAAPVGDTIQEGRQVIARAIQAPATMGGGAAGVVVVGDSTTNVVDNGGGAPVRQERIPAPIDMEPVIRRLLHA